MTIAFFCVLVASVLPIVWIAVAKISSGFKIKDNERPREFLANADDFSKRAVWAQNNAWEALTPFAAAVIIASIVGVDQGVIDSTAFVFIFMRILHGIAYLINKPTFRSIVWTVGMACNFYLYYQVWAYTA